MKLGGIDVGTTGCKLTVYNENGDLLNKEYEAYEISRNAGEHEIDGALIWRGIKTIIRRTTLKIGKIDALGITTFGETFVMLDEKDNILCPSMLYTDPRGTEEVKFFDAQTVMDVAGVKPHSMYSLPKIMWIKKHKPEIYEKTKRILLFQDFIVYLLTGKAQIDRSLAARTMGLDIRKGEWSRSIFETAEIDVEKMSTVVRSGTIAGKVRPELAEELGLYDTVIVNGCHDQVASATGAGAFENGMAVDGTGTVECITPVFDNIPENKGIYEENYAVVPYIEDGKYVCYAFSFTGGAAVKWFRDNFANGKSYQELDETVDDEPGDVLVMPHFAGAATPYMDNGSKAVFLGVTMETTASDLYKAIMEGVTYEISLNLNRLRLYGIKPARFYATGGGASSPVWLQMKADILGCPVTGLSAPEVGSVGTIMLTGVAVGAFENLSAAKKVMIREGKTYYPDPVKHRRYLEKYKRYEKIYQAVRPLFGEKDESIHRA
ncbi:MAG: L-fuculokinase [Candidatus Gallimonas sp.]